MCPWPEYRRASHQREQAAAMLQHRRAKGCLQRKYCTVAVYVGSCWLWGFLGVFLERGVWYQLIWWTVRAGLPDRMPLTQLILAFLSVCSFIKVFLICCLKGSSSPSHIFPLNCVAAERRRHKAARFAKLRTYTLVYGRMCGEKWLGKFWNALCCKDRREGGEHFLKPSTYFVRLHSLSCVFW